MRNLEKIIEDIYNQWKPKTKIDKYVGVHGSDKGEEHESVIYCDENKGEWTPIKAFAFEGHLMTVLRPIIKKVVKD